MGSESTYILVTKAANVLGCDAERVHELCDQGLIRREMKENEVLVRREDVAEIHRLNLLGVIAPGEIIRRLVIAEREIERLRLSVDMLYEINNLSASRYHRLSDEKLYEIYERVMSGSEKDQWSIEEMAYLADVFGKISELEIDRLNEILEIDHSWKHFYALCLRVTRHVATHKLLDTNLNLQRIRDLLTVGRKNLSTIAVLFIEKAGQMKTSYKLLESMANTDIEAFDTIVRSIKKPASKYTV